MRICRSKQKDEIEEIYHNFNGMVQEVQRLMQEHYKLGKEVKMAEVRALQAQINPHFLYNTLDLINWISMDYGAEEIGTLTWNLARFYRLSLNHGKSLITIGEEVEHVQVYVNIENYHFDNQISLNVDVPEELKASPASTSFTALCGKCDCPWHCGIQRNRKLQHRNPGTERGKGYYLYHTG